METSKTLKLKKPLSPLQQARLSQVLNPQLWKEKLKKGETDNRDIKTKENKAKETKEKRDTAKSILKPQNENTSSDERIRTQTKKKQLKEAIGWLCEAYPQCFSQEAPKPLSIGIFNDLLLKGNWPYSKTLLRKILGFYTRSALYQKAILDGRVRYFLTGDIAQEISEFEKNHALEELKALEDRKKTPLRYL